MNTTNDFFGFNPFLRRHPQAWAQLNGSSLYPNINGLVAFYEYSNGVLVVAEVKGLPNPKDACASPVFGFHIHEGDSCTGNSEDPFADAKTHDNPKNCPHPHHAGDLPPLFGANGYAFSACFTNRFAVGEIIGKTVIVHDSPDDFTTQPSGNAGNKIACGAIIGRNRSVLR